MAVGQPAGPAGHPNRDRKIPMSNNTNPVVSAFVRIGAAEVSTGVHAQNVIDFVGDTYDWTAKSAVATAVAAYVAAHGEPGQRTVTVTDENGERKQRATNYGRGFDRVRKAVAAILKGQDDTEKPVVLRVSLSGEGGGTVTIDSDHEFYETLVALIKGE